MYSAPARILLGSAASGGMPNWRSWLCRSFRSYNELANAVLGFLGAPMSEIDVTSIPAAPIAPCRVTTPPVALETKRRAPTS